MAAMGGLEEIVGGSPSIRDLRRRIEELLRRQAQGRGPSSPPRLLPVLIQGETGTGKTMLAQIIHRIGPRAAGRFVDLDCGTIPADLLEAELFGHQKGIFTGADRSRTGLFQTAHGGTLFLDEIGALPVPLQAKFLKAIADGEVRPVGARRNEPADVAIIAATNEDLAAAVRQGRFRIDLYHRLAGVTLTLPPLRDRAADVIMLAERFLAQACATHGLPTKAFGEDAQVALRAYAWPGNIRELGYVIDRAALASDGATVTAEALGLPVTEPEAADSEATCARLLDALTRTSWNITRTAALLGISRLTVRARIKRCGLRPEGEAATGAITAPEPSVEPATEADTKSPAAAEFPRPPLRPGAVRWERRRVTLLRVRLRADSDTPLSVTTPLIDGFADRVRVFGGRVEDVSPRGFLAVFGLEPDEDAPRRAADAALALRGGVGRERTTGDGPPEAAVAAAIHVGVVLVTSLGSAAALDGDAKQEAGRLLEVLERSVEPGEIALSDAASAFLDRRFEVTRQATPDGVLTRLVGRAPDDLRLASTEFVGRHRELALLQGLLEHAGAGRGQIVSIVGAPGIGKSRLVREFARSLAPADAAVLQGRCVPHGASVPYSLVLDVLRRACGVEEPDAPEAVEAKVRNVLDRIGVAASPWVPAVLGLIVSASGEATPSPEAVRDHTFEALQQVLIAQQARQPLLIVLEDLHDIDRLSGELLAAFAGVMPGKRILLVGTARPGASLSWAGRASATQIALTPLGSADSRRVLTSALGGRPAGEDVVTALVARGEGNPLFLEELARNLPASEARSISRVPETVHDVLGMRIHRLPATARDVLQLAAVIGRDVPQAVLESASLLAPDVVGENLALLQAEEFLYATSLGPHAEYTFNHALTWEVAYDSVIEDGRAGLHAQVITAIEHLYPSRLGEHAERLAEHSRRARNWDKTVTYARQAGHKALARSAHHEAVEAFETALGALARLPDTEATRTLGVDLRLETRGALTALGEFARVQERLAEAEALARTLADEIRLGRVRAYQTSYYRQIGDRARALEAGQHALRIGEERGDLALRATAGIYLGHVHYDVGDYRTASDLFSGVVAAVGDQHRLERFGLPYIVSVHARSWLALSLGERGEFEPAIAHARDALVIAETTDHPTTLTSAQMGLGRVLHRAGRVAEAIPVLESALELARANRIQLLLPTIAESLGLSYAQSERIEQGVKLLEEAMHVHVTTRGHAGLAWRAASLSTGYLLAGRDADALRLGQQALELAEKHGERGLRVYALTALAEAADALTPADRANADRWRREAADLRAALGMASFLSVSDQ